MHHWDDFCYLRYSLPFYAEGAHSATGMFGGAGARKVLLSEEVLAIGPDNGPQSPHDIERASLHSLCHDMYEQQAFRHI